MKFGRVEGLIEVASEAEGGGLRLRVFLETNQGVRLVRDDVVLALEGIDGTESLSWQADQYTQETIGVDLAEEGWEVIGASDLPVVGEGEIARSASYAVRQL
jgi:hypothetical protein